MLCICVISISRQTNIGSLIPSSAESNVIDQLASWMSEQGAIEG